MQFLNFTPRLTKQKIETMKNGLFLLTAVFMLGLLNPLAALADKDEKGNAYEFEEVIIIPHTPVKDQYRSGTCWSFSGLGMLER